MTDEEKRSNYLLNRPRTVKNGVRLVENKIGNPSNIFSKEWIETFETLESGNRIAQGKLLAKKGQVMYIKVQKGFLVSKVQDARFKPYKIRIEVNLFTDQQWLKIIEALSLKAIYLAYMLNGKLHDDFLSIFSNEDFSLIPKIKNDLKAACTCSDWANPCKHTAAVFYALANEINTDPFILLKLRGKSKNEFIEILKEKRLSLSKEWAKNFVEPSISTTELNNNSILNVQIDSFISTSNSKTNLPEVLGESPFIINGENASKLFELSYQKISQIASKKINSLK